MLARRHDDGAIAGVWLLHLHMLHPKPLFGHWRLLDRSGCEQQWKRPRQDQSRTPFPHGKTVHHPARLASSRRTPAGNHPVSERRMSLVLQRHKYRLLYRWMHLRPSMFDGQSLAPHAERIGQLLRQTGSTTALDFGCGKALQYKHHRLHEVHGWGLVPSLYDPGVGALAKLPDGPFDAVICTDVLEHVPEPFVHEVLHDIFSRARRLVYLNISTRLAVKRLPNGENAHCTVHPADWWMHRVREHATRQLLVEASFQGSDGTAPVIHTLSPAP